MICVGDTVKKWFVMVILWKNDLCWWNFGTLCQHDWWKSKTASYWKVKNKQDALNRSLLNNGYTGLVGKWMIPSPPLCWQCPNSCKNTAKKCDGQILSCQHNLSLLAHGSGDHSDTKTQIQEASTPAWLTKLRVSLEKAEMTSWRTSILDAAYWISKG